MDALLSWIEAHPGLAAWLQAVGVLFAIGVAIWVPLKQRRDERAEREAERLLKARAVVVLIAPELLELEAQVETVLSQFAAAPPTMMGGAFSFLLAQAGMSVPTMLERSIDRLYLLGDPAGSTLLQLVSVTAQYGRLYERAPLGLTPTASIDAADRLRHLKPHVELMKTLLSQAGKELVPFDIVPTTAAAAAGGGATARRRDG